MENECEALPGVAYPGVRDNRSTINTKTGYDDLYSVCTFTAVNKPPVQLAGSGHLEMPMYIRCKPPFTMHHI